MKYLYFSNLSNSFEKLKYFQYHQITNYFRFYKLYKWKNLPLPPILQNTFINLLKNLESHQNLQLEEYTFSYLEILSDFSFIKNVTKNINVRNLTSWVNRYLKSKYHQNNSLACSTKIIRPAEESRVVKDNFIVKNERFSLSRRRS